MTSVLPDAAAAHYRSQQRLTVATLALLRRTWAQMGVEFDASWVRVAAKVQLLALSAQLGAARAAEPYLTAVLAEVGLADEPVGTVRPEAFVGVAGDGRPLDTLLYGAVTQAKTVAKTSPSAAALAAGGRWLEMTVHTLIADTARQAVGVGMTARPAVKGYVRMLNPPSCSRCAILAGRWYRWNAGFDRHPRCDCRAIPVSESMAGDLTTDPRAYFDSLSRAEQDRHFTATGAQAIRDGADIGQVVNARRGMERAQVFGRELTITTEGTTRRGAAFRVLAERGGTVTERAGTATRLTRSGPAERAVTQTRARAPRLMPESIYDIAGDNRDEAIRLLRINGFIS